MAFSPYASVEAGDTQYEVTSISSEVLSIRLKDDADSGGLQTIIPDNSFITRRWRFADLFDAAPRQSEYNRVNGRGTGDEIHIAVFDTTGLITGFDVNVAGQRTNSVLETFANLSLNPSAKGPQGDSIYYPTVLLINLILFIGVIILLLVLIGVQIQLLHTQKSDLLHYFL